MKNRLYQRTFDQIRMSGEGTDRVRSELASRCAQKELEEINMKNRTGTRRPLAAIVAVCAVLALSVTAFASSGIAERVFHMLSGDTISVGMDEDGEAYVSEGFVGDAPASPVEERGGRLYFTAGGEDIDITGLCSYETPYLHTLTDAGGQRHVFIIGGEPGAIGWAECMMDGDGEAALGAFVVTLAPEAGDAPAPWLDAGMELLGQQMELEIVE